MKRICIGLAFAAVMTVPALAAQPASFNVFFEQDSAVLTNDGAVIVASAAKAIRHSRDSRIIISAGNAKYGEARFHSVQAALLADGVSNERIVRANLAKSVLSYDPIAADRVAIVVQPNHPLQTAMAE